jgi:hypothetical protein
MSLKRYQRRPDTTVHALRLALDTEGFDYVKWGARQHCKAGDWIVQNGEDTYTVDADVFSRTYRLVGGSEYRKVGTVWAEKQVAPGTIPTKEGSTAFEPGDYVVYNDAEQTDGYAVQRAKFESLYEPAD